MVNTIGSVLGTEDEGPKSIGLEVGNKAVDATGVPYGFLFVSH